MPIWFIPAILATACGLTYIIVSLIDMAKEDKQARVELIQKREANLQAGFRARSTSKRAPHTFNAA